MHKTDAGRYIETARNNSPGTQIEKEINVNVIAELIDDYTNILKEKERLYDKLDKEEERLALLLEMIPGGVGIATDATCKEILHNSVGARFLRINDGGKQFSFCKFLYKVYT